MHVANSPFKIMVGQSEIGEASRVKAYGKGLVEAHTFEVAEFFVDTRNAGTGTAQQDQIKPFLTWTWTLIFSTLSPTSGYGGLALSIEGPSKVDINCEDMEDGTCRVTYCPTEPGNYNVNIKFAEKHIPGSDLGCVFVVMRDEIQQVDVDNGAACRKSLHSEGDWRGTHQGEHHQEETGVLSGLGGQHLRPQPQNPR